jgi:hypothetical protein
VSEVPEALVGAGSALFMTILFSLFVANLVGGGHALPLGLASDQPVRRDLLGRSGAVVFFALAVAPQVIMVFAAIGPYPLFGGLGTAILLAEPAVALAWAWYLTKRYERSAGDPRRQG